MLLMVEKWTRGWIFHSVNRNANPNNKYMEDGDKNKESSYLNYWDVNNSDGWAIHKSHHLGLSMLELIETLIYEFSCDYMKLNYGEKAKQCFMNTESSIVSKI